MKTDPRLLLPLLLLFSCTPKSAETERPSADVTSGAVHVTKAELRETLPTVEDGVLYLTVSNTGPTPVKLLGVRTSAARDVMPMRDHSGARHDPIDLTIAPKSSLVFKPGGDHLMLMNVTRPLRKGEKVPVTLSLQPGGDITLDVPVNPY
ncbi:copper chaperone PCu(A)C [Deinococcus pimensis]|uniref:copper chaperone PCu(A)C n=1 Tax=Deinococcus pimensis TaxID=309888 RepID=UPI000694C962|nr:copper chaperone PCu(A)C [Deinococcus pimensis]